MSPKRFQSSARHVRALFLAFSISVAVANAAPAPILLKPEDPVILPTDAETEKVTKKIRDDRLEQLKQDPDGWDDLWIIIQKAQYSNYQFDPKNRTKDTDGDGLSDYEEMLAHRDASRKEPIYTKEQLIEQVREGRRQAIQKEKEEVVKAAKRREELAPYIIQPLLIDNGTPASKETVENEGKQKLAALAIKNATAAGAARQRADTFATKNKFDKHVREADGRVSSLIDVIDGIPQFYTTNNSVSADTISTDEVRAGGSLGLNLSGAGTTIGLWDGGDVYTIHNEFTTGGQRITDKDGVSPLGINFHPTHVSGTMIAKGVASLAKGMAYNAALSAYDWNSDIAEMTSAASADGLRLSNHSYGGKRGWDTITSGGVTYSAWYGDTSISNTEDYLFGFYSSVSSDLDLLAYNAPNYLSVWSAGNERQVNSIANGPTTQPVNHFAFNGATGLFTWTVGVTRPVDGNQDLLMGQGLSKNVITVAAVEDLVGGWTTSSGVAAAVFSSFGPPDDGRIKPDIAANGVNLLSTWNTATNVYNYISGTSMAAPSITGSLDLLIEHHNTLFGAGKPFRAATLKALTLHTADEAGLTPGPDYSYGWGLMNTKKAAELMTLHAASGTALRNMKQIVLNNGDFVEFPVRASGGTPLKVTICWTDPAGTVPAKAVDANVAALVNDLDLRIISGASNFYPWKLDPAAPTAAATNIGDNNRDNVEQVMIATPTAGQIYTVKVTHKGMLKNAVGATAPQELSVIISGIQPDPEPVFDCKGISSTGTNIYAVSWTSVVGASYRLQFSPDLITWTDLTGDFVATKTITVGEVSNPPGDVKYFWRAKRLP